MVGVGLAAKRGCRVGAKFTSHLIQEALHQDNQGEGNRVQAEEDVITLHRVHSIRVFEEKLLLCGGDGEKLRVEGWPGHCMAWAGLRWAGSVIPQCGAPRRGRC